MWTPRPIWRGSTDAQQEGGVLEVVVGVRLVAVVAEIHIGGEPDGIASRRGGGIALEVVLECECALTAAGEVRTHLARARRHVATKWQRVDEVRGRAHRVGPRFEIADSDRGP